MRRSVIGLIAVCTALASSAQAQQNVMSATEKGSLFVIPKVELRWDAAGNLIQNTYVHLQNDQSSSVNVLMYFINGDDPIGPNGQEPGHPGWNVADLELPLTTNQPFLIDLANSGALPPFTVLDPPFGRPDPEGGTERVLRGAIVGWAVDFERNPIRFNHLHATATIVNHDLSAAWGYNGYHSQVVSGVAEGQVVNTNGTINLDGLTYAPPPAAVEFNFVGGTLAGEYEPGLAHNTDIAMLAFDLDLRQIGTPRTTLLDYSVWNENGTKFTGLTDCITCWHEQVVSLYIPDHFTVTNLATDVGRARVSGIASAGCPDSVDVPLLGVVERLMLHDFTSRSSAGFNMTGVGTQTSAVRYEPQGSGEPRVTANADDDDRLTPSGMTPPGSAPAESGADADRVDATALGSAFVIPNVDVGYTSDGVLRRNTYIHLSNVGPAPVRVQMAFVNGDDTNFITQQVIVGAESPVWWAADDGHGEGVAPWTALDPPFGRPNPEAAFETMVRGYIVGWAVDDDGAPIRWDYLNADATVVDLFDHASSGYNAYQFVAAPIVADGEAIGTPGVLRFDGGMYGPCFNTLLNTFITDGSSAYSIAGASVVAASDLTHVLLERDLALAPPTSKADFRVWNENEFQFSGMYICVDGWNQTLVANYGVPNFMLFTNLASNLGRYRVNYISSQLCTNAIDAAGLGTHETQLDINQTKAAAGHLMAGAGTETALFRRPGPPPSVNLDFGALGTPPSSYAAAGAPGAWLEIPGVTANTAVELLNGLTPSGITMIPSTTRGTFSSDNPGTSGNEALLLDDALDLGGDLLTTLQLYGLDIGTYDVLTYAWAPDNAAFFTDVDVVQAVTGPVTVGGPWPGGLVEGTTHARHRVQATSGAVTIEAISTPGTLGTVNGIQIVKVTCLSDIDGDGQVAFTDLVSLLSDWGPCPGCPTDLDGDGIVGFTDLVSLLSDWGPCP